MEKVKIKDNEGASPVRCVPICTAFPKSIDLSTLIQIPKFAKHYLDNTTTRIIFCGQTFNSLFAQRFMQEEIMVKSDQLRWRDVIRNTHLRYINQKIFDSNVPKYWIH